MPNGIEFVITVVIIILAGISFWYIARLNSPKRMYVSNYRRKRINFKNDISN